MDEKSFLCARHNIELNRLNDRIQLLKTEAHDPLLPLDALCLDRYTNTFHELYLDFLSP